jgi:hypothetical protein
MEYARDAGHGTIERRRVPQVSDETLRLESLKRTRVARRTHQDAHSVAAPGKLPRHVIPEKARRSGD